MNELKVSVVDAKELLRIDSLVVSCSKLKTLKGLSVEEQGKILGDFEALMKEPGLFWGRTIPEGILAAIRPELSDLGFSREEIQDIAQEIFIKLFLKFPADIPPMEIENGPEPGVRLRLFQGWLTTVCRNKVKDIRKSKQPKPTSYTPIEEHAEKGHEKCVSMVGTFDEAWYFTRIEELKDWLPAQLKGVVDEAVQPETKSTPPTLKERRKLRYQIERIRRFFF